MSKRLNQPDTEADIKLQSCFNADKSVSFVMISGAGSGKTTSLVKALDYLRNKRGHILRRKGQKIACITYTEVAEKEILDEIGLEPIFHVSTIHSFLWTLIKPFQTEIRKWVGQRIQEKIAEAEERISNPRTRANTLIKLKSDVERFNNQLSKILHISHFTYSTGSDYGKGVLGHDDILKMVPAFITERPLFRVVIADRFPYVFVDESQDTAPHVVEALKAIYIQSPNKFSLGFFGDPMQKIYLSGVGAIDEIDGWIRIEKQENFRSPAPVLSVINQIRTHGDGLVQVLGVPEGTTKGSVKVFVLPIDELRNKRLQAVRRRLSVDNSDPLWISDDPKADIRLLVIVHRMAALRLGFAELYSAFNDNQPPAFLKDNFSDGTSWALTPFLRFVLPLVEAARKGNQFDVISLLRQNSPLLAKENLSTTSIASTLQKLKESVAKLSQMLSEDSSSTVADIFRFIRDSNLFLLEERLGEYLSVFHKGLIKADDDEEILVGANAMASYFECPAKQLWAYQTYIENESPYSTQQGIKGAEFTRVLTVLDDEEGAYNLFSYNKYFGITPLSDKDVENITAGIDSVMERTRRLFYVCCSRALKDLAVVVFTHDTNLAFQKILESKIFSPESVSIFDEM